MSLRSDAHQCEVCGTYGFHGFKQTDGDYYWFCLAHRLEGYKLPDLAPPPELKGQLTFDLNASVDGMETFKNVHCGQQELDHLATRPTSEALPAGTEGMAENWRLDVEKLIGAPSNPNLVGSAALELKNEGYLDYVKHVAPRDRKSHGSKKALWRRTDRMTQAQYAKAKALAADERTDPATRAAAQRQVEKWKAKFEGTQNAPEKKLHPGRVQSPEYQAWAKNMEVGNRERK